MNRYEKIIVNKLKVCGNCNFFSSDIEYDNDDAYLNLYCYHSKMRYRDIGKDSKCCQYWQALSEEIENALSEIGLEENIYD